MDYAVGKHRGFAFVEYHSPEDAEEAAFNLDGSDFLGRTLRVSLAQPNQAGKLSSSSSGAIAGLAADGSQALWKSDEWFRTQILEDAGGGGAGASEERARRDEAETDAKALRG
jgi:RNA recognition motif-containing protein